MKVYDSAPAGQADASEPERTKVGIAEYEVTSGGDVLTTSGLGSCVGVALYDRTTGTAGLVHVMLPDAGEPDDNPAKFADTGIELLLEELEAAGADRRDVVAKIAGGSDMLDFSNDGSGIGERNVERVRDTLDAHDIPLAGEDVGGDYGRSLRFEPGTGDLTVKSADRDEIRL